MVQPLSSILNKASILLDMSFKQQNKKLEHLLQQIQESESTCKRAHFFEPKSIVPIMQKAAATKQHLRIKLAVSEQLYPYLRRFIEEKTFGNFPEEAVVIFCAEYASFRSIFTESMVQQADKQIQQWVHTNFKDLELSVDPERALVVHGCDAWPLTTIASSCTKITFKNAAVFQQFIQKCIDDDEVFEEIKTLELDFRTGLCPSDSQCLRKIFPRLQTLDMYETTIDAECFKKTSVRIISFKPDATVRFVGDTMPIQESDIEHIGPGEYVFVTKTNRIKVKSELSDSDFISFVFHAQDLEAFHVTDCPSLSDKAVRALAKKHPNLKEITLQCCSALTDAALITLATHCAQGVLIKKI